MATFIPISANGIGVREGLFVVLLLRTHVPLPMATALALFVDLQMIPFAVLGGMVFLSEHGLLRSRRAAATQPQRPRPRVSATPAPQRVVDETGRNR